MIKQKYPYEVALPQKGQIIIFRNKNNGWRFYKIANGTPEGRIVKMDDEVNGETFNIYEKNISSVINDTEDTMEILDTDDGKSKRSGIDLVTVKFCCVSQGSGAGAVVLSGSIGGARGRTGAAGATGATGATGAAGAGLGGYAEYVQYTQAPNNSVASGLALELLTDNPTGVYNTIGITIAGAPTQGTAFNLPIGVYMVDYETSTVL